MSHLATMETEYNNVDAIRMAAEALAVTAPGVKLEGAGQARYWGGRSEECDLVLRLPGNYDVGFKLNANGTYSARADSEAFGGSYSGGADARRILGNNLEKFTEQYTIARLNIEAQLAGGSFNVEGVQEDGSILAYAYLPD